MEMNPVQNDLILSRILHHLTIKEVKNCRLVSLIWDAEGRKLLKKRCILTLNFEYGPTLYDENIKLRQYYVDMENLPLQNWRIFLPTLKYSLGQLDNLLQFVDERTHFITKLCLVGHLECRQDYEVRHKILTAIASTLEELELGGVWQWKEDNYVFPESLGFPFLQTLTLSQIVRDFPEDTSMLPWLRGLVGAVRGVTSIHLKCDPILSSIFLECLAQLPRTSVSNLNKITLKVLTPRVIRSLLKLKQGFKTLELGEVSDMRRPEDFVSLEELLRKHSPTLENLQFTICPMNPDNREIIGIRLPQFPALRRLNIGLGLVFNSIFDEEMAEEWIGIPRIELTFPGGSGINYKEHFPSLQALTLWPMRKGEKYTPNRDSVAVVAEEIGNLYEMFIPGIAQNYGGHAHVVSSVQELDILEHVFIRNEMRTLSLFTNPAVVRRIRIMFPNARLTHHQWHTK